MASALPVAFVHSPAYAGYCFGPGHPFSPVRLELTIDLLRMSGVLTDADFVAPRPATREELLYCHSEQYIRAVEEASATGAADGWVQHFDLGTDDNPVFRGMHEAASLIVGGTITATELVMEGRVRHACNLGGGLHHAMAERASGFCIYNDAAIAAAWARRRYGARVMYIDTDAHHGDGVQWAFYDDPNVMTVSIHETPRHLFPGTGWVHEVGTGAGLGTSVNVPLEPYTGDESFLACLEHVLLPLAEAFKPDLIISQNGCDAHYLDPLTHLSATLRLYRDIPRLVQSVADAVCAGRWVAVGGGGYDHWRVVPRAWAMVWAQLAGRPLPDELPAAWREKWAPRAPVPLPERLLDDPSDYKPAPRPADIAAKNRRTAERALAEATAWLRRAADHRLG